MDTHTGVGVGVSWWGRGEWPDSGNQKPYSCLELCRAEQIESNVAGGGLEEGGCQMDEHQESLSVLK